MAIAVVQKTSGTAIVGSTTSATFSADTTTGNTIVVGVQAYRSGGPITVSSIALNAGAGTFTKLIGQAATTTYPGCEFWAAPNITGGVTPKVTVTLSVAPNNVDCFIYELNGMPSTLVSDGTAAGRIGTEPTFSSPAITTTGINDIVFAGFAPTHGITAPQSGWTGTIGPSTAGLSEYKLFTTAQSALVATATGTGTAAFGSIICALQGSVIPPVFPMAIADSSAVVLAFHGATAAPAGNPTLIQSAASGMDIFGLTTLNVTFPNPSLAGNLLVTGFQFASAGTVSSVKDNNGTSWSPGPFFTNSTSGQKAFIYYLANAPANTTSLVVTVAGLNSATNCKANIWVQEYNNIALVSPVDGTIASNSSASPGTLTTTAGGDLVLHWALDLSDSGVNGGGYDNTPIVAGSGFTPAVNDNQVGSFVQYIRQSSAGAIAPACTPAGVAIWGSLAIAFKSALTGTLAPAGIRIRHVQGYALCGYATTVAPLPLAFPSSGNLIVGVSNYERVTAVSDSAGNTYSIPPACQANNSAAAGLDFYSSLFYAANAVTSPTLHALTLTLSVNGKQCFVVLYDIAGAATVPFDRGATAIGDQETPGNLTSVSITPSTANGLVIAQLPVYYNSINGLVGAGYILDSVWNAYNSNYPNGGGTPPGPLCEDNGYGHVYNVSTSALTFVWTYNLTGVGSVYPGVKYWAASAAAFIAAPTGAPLHFPLTVSGTSSATIGFHVNVPLHFALTIADTSSVTIGFRVNRRFPLAIADSSSVRLTWLVTSNIKHFPLNIADSSLVTCKFENDFHQPPPEPPIPAPPFTGTELMPPYTGQNQSARINVPASIAYREAEREEGCWLIPPYASIFPEVPNAQIQETQPAVVPPPISKVDLWSAMQTFPL